ncbi:MAG: cell division protein FtsA [Candidatus Latescibacteria bacterium]|nr:cell division protein FtsA [Candidatus Latescibacterota bacterium]
MAGSPIVVLDIGASKVVCMVGEVQADEKIKILGVGNCPCTGLRRNVVIDMPKVVGAIGGALREAERSAGVKITGAFVGLAGEDIITHTNRSTIAISGVSNPIDEEDVQRAMTAAEQIPEQSDARVLHRIVQSYTVDGELVQNPLWLHGHKLEVEALSITASSHICSTLERAAREAGVDIASFIMEPVAAASAAVSQDEHEMGVALLDIGAGTSDLAVFHGPLRHVAEIPFGGDDLTKDLSMVLNTSPREAEQLKREYGQLLPPQEQLEKAVPYRSTANREEQIPLEQLSAILAARQQEIFEFVQRELDSIPHGRMLAAGLVLTGGGAQLGGVAQLGEQILDMPVRLGAPLETIGADVAQNPTFATAVGLLRFAAEFDGPMEAVQEAGRSESFMDKISRLLSFF